MLLAVKRFGRVASLIALGSCALLAQGTQTANVAGEIVDQNGKGVVGATIRLTSPSLQGERKVVSEANGRFATRLLPPGVYTITVTKDGATSRIVQQLGVDQTFSPRITLATNVSTVTVEVVASTPAVDKTEVKSATNITSDDLDKLPNARTVEGAAFLAPGVTAGVGGRVQIRGAMTSGNLYLLDGQNISDNTYNNRGVRLIDDSIEETQVLTGAISAEYGQVDGGVINAVTRSGSNKFTGQLRWELSNPNWDAMKPMENRTARSNILGEQKTLSVGGYILKDRLWFYGSYFTTDTSGNATISGSAAPGPGAMGTSYTTTSKEIRRQMKLTWLINQDHTLVASYMNSRTDDTNRNYSAGEIRALVPQISKSGFLNIAIRSIWTPDFTSEIRFGDKTQELGAGGTPNGLSVIRDASTGLCYQNGLFSMDDPDKRNNRTMNAKVSYFLEAAGSHQFDAGLDYYKGNRIARNEQSPTQWIMYMYNPTYSTTAGWTAEGAFGYNWVGTTGEAPSESYGLYLNDKWSLNNKLTFQLGARFDKYDAKDQGGKTIASAAGISPRLGASYDIFGDSSWTAKVSYCIYNGKVQETVFNNVTGTGAPNLYGYAYNGPGGQQPFSVLNNQANYDRSTYVAYRNSKVNVSIDDGLKAPHVTEIMLGLAHTFRFQDVDGFVRVTGVDKKWKDLVDQRNGQDGTVTLPTGGIVYMQKWINSKLATRDYRGLELDGRVNYKEWSVGGNITWSTLRGNYEGEGTSTPGSGEPLENWTIVNGQRMISEDLVAPYGYLAGHTPIRMRFDGAYSAANALGKTTFGWVYRFDSGGHYSDARTISTARLNPNLPSAAGTSFTQYKDYKRGQGIFPSVTYFDVAITHEFQLFKVAGVPVLGFFKIRIDNFFNHMQQIGWVTTWNAATGTYPTAIDSPWVPTSTYGKATSAGHYGTGRQFFVSAGVRF